MLGARRIESTLTVAVKLDRQLEGDVGKESRVVIYSVGSQSDRSQASLVCCQADLVQNPKRNDKPVRGNQA